MRLLTLLLALLLLPASASAEDLPQIDNNVQARIVNGNVAPPGSWPSQALVSPADTALCGGTVVRSRWILTAGHCVYGFNNSRTTVATGTRSLYAPRQLIEGAYLHPGFNPYTLDRDIALLRLRNPANGPAARLATLGDRQYYSPGATSYTAGWGKTCFGDDCPISAQLLQTSMPITSFQDCQNAYYPEELRGIICAGGDGSTDACQGDSGGPLEVDGASGRILVGIVSWGYECALPGFPGVYTEVALYRDWIGSYITNTVRAPKKVSFRGTKKARVHYNDALRLPTTVRARTSNGKVVRVAHSSCNTLSPGGSCTVRLQARSKKKKSAKVYLLNRAGVRMATINVKARR